LNHVEIENSKLKDTQRKLRSELVSCEKTVVRLKKQLEDFQKMREETISLKEDVWISVASGYNASKKPKSAAQKEAKRNNKLAIDTILDGLTDSVKSKVGSCASAKHLWDKLQELYAREEAEEEEEVEEDYNISDFKE
jgi:hypothetical protein